MKRRRTKKERPSLFFCCCCVAIDSGFGVWPFFLARARRKFKWHTEKEEEGRRDSLGFNQRYASHTFAHTDSIRTASSSRRDWCGRVVSVSNSKEATSERTTKRAILHALVHHRIIILQRSPRGIQRDNAHGLLLQHRTIVRSFVRVWVPRRRRKKKILTTTNILLLFSSLLFSSLSLLFFLLS